MTRWQVFERALLLQGFILWFYTQRQPHSFCLLGLVTIILKIFQLCLCSSKMNNLSSSLYLHLEPDSGLCGAGTPKADQSCPCCPGHAEPHCWHTSGLALPPGALRSLRHPKNHRSGRFSQTCWVPLGCISRAGAGCQRGSAEPWHGHQNGTELAPLGVTMETGQAGQSQRNERTGRVKEQ